MNPFTKLRRQLTPAQINFYFSIVCFFSPPVLGSLVSITFNAGGVWSAMLLAAKRRRFNIDGPMLALTAAIYAYCAAMVLASIVNGTLAADLRFFLPLITFLLFPISYSTWSITEKTALARIAILASAAACFGALAIAIVQYHWLGTRAEGGAGNAIVFATVTCLAVMLCLAGALSGIEKRWKLLVLAAIAGAIAIVYSGSRMIWVAVPIAGIVVLLVNRRRFTNVSMARLAVIGVVVALAIAAIGSRAIMDRADFLVSDWDALNANGDHSTALGLRVAMWEIGLAAVREMPIFGHGITASRALMKQGFHEQFGLSAGFSHFHNGFLTAMVEAGLLGGLALASIFIVAAWNAARTLRLSVDPVERFGATMVLVAVITYLIGGMAGILVGHDILDATLMVFLVSGTYLASGRTVAPTGKDAPAVAPGASRQP
ncbi:MAG: O-antigen ligase family protein [Mesorhizobium sp.]|uniref:O-antigen ligase family protein n=2 Tax=Mesorhizobium TaxID=68287 RepID=UPI000FCA989D|nr:MULTISPECIES: O-antigen ligase family protein [unclassified Mesorhizobium]RUW41890.1 O-antigen ligase family protein [Mesorhizobium sp. M2A.F.Ca.ET.015.02.1.1]RVC95354.1 O-antigen ligase family protein [Mesorhizobium sp. M2A.F.Ca.ET.017.03.2.1]RWB44202.1 MAG: O-antigen ligase family protein [Mesorhizobium sp.]RWB60894.1 MAG: O-antigen ligase family protein [Mesorhizobium sp.]RWB83162.1 MAG: O-antigen ligase family protein [Mesorhizobium sp.]